MTNLSEREVEDRLVANPSLLEAGLTLVARQPTIDAGRPDLIGVDEAGKLVVFELKIEQTTGDAVAQALDYSTWLNEAGLIGAHKVVSAAPRSVGIAAIDNILSWYYDRFPDNKPEGMLPARVVLVGSGADPATERMTSQLRNAGVSIELRLLPDLAAVDGASVRALSESRPRSDAPAGARGRRPLNTSGKNWRHSRGQLRSSACQNSSPPFCRTLTNSASAYALRSTLSEFGTQCQMDAVSSTTLDLTCSGGIVDTLDCSCSSMYWG